MRSCIVTGNPKGPDAPNKKQYDPRAYLKEAEKGVAARLGVACDDLCSSGKTLFRK